MPKRCRRVADTGAVADAARAEEATKRPKKKSKKAQTGATQVAAADAEDHRDGAMILSSKEAKLVKKKALKSDKKGKKEAAKKERQAKAAANTAKNDKLRKEGKMTRKEKFKAAYAAKKAALQSGGASKTALQDKGLQAKLLEKAGLDTLDPKAKECFLTGLPYGATERHVQAHFANVGACRVKLLLSEAGRSNGTAFLTFDSAQEALKATTLDRSTLQKRWIGVRLCQVKGSGQSTKLTAGRPEDKPEGCLGAFVSCDPAVSEDQLWELFDGCNVVNIGCMMDRETGKFRGRAFLDFEDTADVDKAVAKSGQTLSGAPCFVRYKREKPAEGGKDRKPPAKGRSGGPAEHNLPAPVPPPSGKATKFQESEDENGEA